MQQDLPTGQLPPSSLHQQLALAVQQILRLERRVVVVAGREVAQQLAAVDAAPAEGGEGVGVAVAPGQLVGDEGVQPRPSEEDIALVRDWINEDLASGFDSPRPFVTAAEELAAMRDDLETLPESSRRFVRYFNLTHLYNAGVPDAELTSHRLALSKLINFLSRSASIQRPVAINAPLDTIFRINLVDYGWDVGEDQVKDSTSTLFFKVDWMNRCNKKYAMITTTFLFVFGTSLDPKMLPNQ